MYVPVNILKESYTNHSIEHHREQEYLKQIVEQISQLYTFVFIIMSVSKYKYVVKFTILHPPCAVFPFA